MKTSFPGLPLNLLYSKLENKDEAVYEGRSCITLNGRSGLAYTNGALLCFCIFGPRASFVRPLLIVKTVPWMPSSGPVPVNSTLLHVMLETCASFVKPLLVDREVLLSNKAPLSHQQTSITVACWDHLWGFISVQGQC